MKRILLVRHGRSTRFEAAGWLDDAGFRRWLEEYEQASLMPDEVAPPGLNGDHIVSSDLPRAIQSAALLAPGAAIVTTPLLRESSFPIPSTLGMRLPPGLWYVALTIRWLYGVIVREKPDPEVRRRVAEAADWLIAHDEPLTIAVTHGNFRRLLARELRARGWQLRRPRKQWAYWSAWELTQA